jgi:hypothetical protein
VAEVERNLKLQDAVIKFMTVQSADDVDIEALTIDPEETTLGKFELPPEDEKEESREKQLGLIDLGPEAPRAPRPIEDFEGEDPEDGDERPAAAAPAAPVGGAAKPESEEET